MSEPTYEVIIESGGEIDVEISGSGPRGAKGDTGDDGFSPIVTVTEISGGHRVTIEDAAQTQTFDVMDGVDTDTLGLSVVDGAINLTYTE